MKSVQRRDTRRISGEADVKSVPRVSSEEESLDDTSSNDLTETHDIQPVNECAALGERSKRENMEQSHDRSTDGRAMDSTPLSRVKKILIQSGKIDGRVESAVLKQVKNRLLERIEVWWNCVFGAWRQVKVGEIRHLVKKLSGK